LISNLKKNKNFRSEHNFYQKNKPITISEVVLIDECLMVLSGLKPNLVFLFNQDDVKFNSKFQLQSLNKVDNFLIYLRIYNSSDTTWC